MITLRIRAKSVTVVLKFLQRYPTPNRTNMAVTGPASNGHAQRLPTCARQGILSGAYGGGCKRLGAQQGQHWPCATRFPHTMKPGLGNGAELHPSDEQHAQNKQGALLRPATVSRDPIKQPQQAQPPARAELETSPPLISCSKSWRGSDEMVLEGGGGGETWPVHAGRVTYD